MDDDQVRVFCNEANIVQSKDNKAVPIIGMCYGTKKFSIITDGLKKRNFDPDKHAFIAKNLFRRICNDDTYYDRLPDLIKTGSNKATSNEKLIKLIDEKVIEITKGFESKYTTIEDLLQCIYKS